MKNVANTKGSIKAENFSAKIIFVESPDSFRDYGKIKGKRLRILNKVKAWYNDSEFITITVDILIMYYYVYIYEK